MNKKRYITEHIEKLCFSRDKMAFIAGPRQCGKTTLAKRLLSARKLGQYYNWDETTFRRLWAKNPSEILPTEQHSVKPLIVLDEIHKAKLWKRTLKGVFDTMTYPCDILVTGSAKLDIYRKGSDSLMGRYIPFRLHPFSLAELLKNFDILEPELLIEQLFEHTKTPKKANQDSFELLMNLSAFPDPLFDGTMQYLRIWRKTRTDQIVREDLRDLSRLPELSQIEMLIALLPERAASTLSIQSLSEDLEVAYTTIKRWLTYLKQLYYFFEVKPFSNSIIRSYKKMSKLYLWDWSEIEYKGARFENVIAFHLLKYCNLITDLGYGDLNLRYLRNKEQKEIDFLILKDKKPWLPIKIKLTDETPSKNWSYFLTRLPCTCGIQVVMKPGVFKIVYIEGKKVLIISASDLLNYLV